MQLIDRLADTGLLKHQGYVDGAWVGADQGRTYAVEDPATGVEIGQVADMGGDETRRAIAATEGGLAGVAARPPRNGPRSCANGST